MQPPQHNHHNKLNQGISNCQNNVNQKGNNVSGSLSPWNEGAKYGEEEGEDEGEEEGEEPGALK